MIDTRNGSDLDTRERVSEMTRVRLFAFALVEKHSSHFDSEKDWIISLTQDEALFCCADQTCNCHVTTAWRSMSSNHGACSEHMRYRDLSLGKEHYRGGVFHAGMRLCGGRYSRCGIDVTQ